MKKSYRISLKILAAVLGIWLGITLILQLVLSPAILTGIVNKYANEYLDANVSFSKTGLSMFRRFPNAEIVLDSCAITYPSDRYSEIIRKPSTLRMARMGTAAGFRGFEMDSIPDSAQDTLAVFNKLKIAVNPFALIGWRLKLSEINLDKPRIFLHSYDSLHANWNIFGESEEADSSETSFELPAIVLGKVELSGHPHIVYSSSTDTVSAIINMKRLALRGMIDDKLRVTKPVRLEMDSMFVAGRLATDTLIAGVDYMRIKGSRAGEFDTDIHANAFWGSQSWGRLRIPIYLKGKLEMVEDSVMTVRIPQMQASVAHIPMSISESLISSHSDSLYIRLNLNADEVHLDSLLQSYGKQIIMDEASKLQTDAIIRINAEMDGWYVYEPERYPPLTASISIPKAGLGYEGIKEQAKISLDGKIETDEQYRYNLSLDKVDMTALDSTYFRLRLDVNDLLGKDPLMKIDARLKSDLDSLTTMLPPEMGISADGNLFGRVRGNAYLSQLDMKNICHAQLYGGLRADKLVVEDSVDSLSLKIKSLNIDLSSSGNEDNEDMKKGERVLSLAVSVDSLAARYCNAFDIKLDKMNLSAQNSAKIVSSAEEGRFYPFLGKLSIGKLDLMDSDSTAIRLKGSQNSFRVSPKKNHPNIPVLRLSSHNRFISFRNSDLRAGLRAVNFDATAAMNTIERAAKRKALLDSLATVYPDTPRDSLLKTAFKSHSPKQLPSWLSEKDFQSNDVNLKLDESMAKYFREWDINAKVGIAGVRLTTPYFPLRTSVENASMSVTNNRIVLDSFCLKAGESDVDMAGEINGLKRALLGRGPIDLNLKLSASKLNGNELLTAYSVGSAYTPAGSTAHLEDDEYERMVEQKTEQVKEEEATGSSLLVVPANVRAKINLEGYDVSYSNMNIDWLNCEITMKERCIQIANTIAAANMGNLFFEGFYSTRTKKDIKAGFNLSLLDITAAEVIDMIPQIDSLVPMLKSFDGLLNCELAGTTALDTAMNVIMPSASGVMRISGKNLTLEQDKDLRKITRLLRFRNRKEFRINNMSVEGMVKDSKLEIFPFLLELDRYKVAMSGVQNMDMSFRYHVSVIRSPLVFKFGVDLYGNDFDNLKFKIGRAKYRNAKSVPAFSSTIDQSRMNLSESIRKIFERGVEKAVAENEKQAAIKARKEEISYVSSIDQPMEELSEEERQKMAEEENNLDKPDDGEDDGGGEDIANAEDNGNNGDDEDIATGENNGNNGDDGDGEDIANAEESK